MTRAAKLGALGAALLVAGCGTAQEEALWCPNVEAVAGLDRLALSYPGADAPVPTRLDVVETICIADGDDLLVGSSVAVRLGEGKPAGDVRVPYTVVLDGPAGPQDARTDVAVVPAGAVGVTTYLEHRFAGLATRDDVAVRLLYALVADDEARRRLAQERPSS